jgi:hypothetical protein
MQMVGYEFTHVIENPIKPVGLLGVLASWRENTWGFVA